MFTYAPLGTFCENQRKTTEHQGTKQINALKALKPEEDLKALKTK